MLVRAMRRRPRPPTGGIAGEIRRRRGISTDRTLAADTQALTGFTIAGSSSQPANVPQPSPSDAQWCGGAAAAQAPLNPYRAQPFDQENATIAYGSLPIPPVLYTLARRACRCVKAARG